MDSTSSMIAVHELGHSFAGLADEYASDEVGLHKSFPLPTKLTEDIRSPNVTYAGRFDGTDFASLRKTVRWRHFLDLPDAKKFDWLHEGGCFRAKDVFRPWAICRMRTNADPFCPVCCEEVAKAIVATCGEEWDDAAYHKAHSLKKEVWGKRRRCAISRPW